jgi:hypothetical protein
MPEFKVPTGCRDAMTNLHNAHTARFNKVVTKLKQAHENDNRESDKLLGVYMNTHRMLHTVINNAIDTHNRGEHKIATSDLKDLKSASKTAEDIHSSLTRGIRTDGRSTTIMEPTGHLERIIKNIRKGSKAINPVSMGGKIKDATFLRRQKAIKASRAAQQARDRNSNA